jgi:hypothetical protein
VPPIAKSDLFRQVQADVNGSNERRSFTKVGALMKVQSVHVAGAVAI